MPRNRGLACVTFGSLLAATLAGTAYADPTPFTWRPSAVGLIGADIVGADNYNVANFASISIDPITGSFTEIGVLKVLGFLDGGTQVASPGLGSTYSLYATFT